MYNWFLSTPNATDREFVDELCCRRAVSKVTAYDDLSIVKALLPKMSDSAREFHRWRYNEMILATYNMAKARKDTKTMERAATSYARYNHIETQDEKTLPLDMILVQPFTATDDPSVLGIKPIPNLRQRIDYLLGKYRRETPDIDDIRAEEVDLESDTLFLPPSRSSQES